MFNCQALFADHQLVAKREHDDAYTQNSPDIYDEVVAMDEKQDDKNVQIFFRRGVSYVRWGRTVCPPKAEVVYVGRAAGSFFSHRGGGANYQCVTLKPENFDFGPGTIDASLIYGAEYETTGNVPKTLHTLQNNNVPCVVCYVATRSTKIMVPGTYKCPAEWTTEYYGFLMAERHNHHRSSFECVDKTPEKADGGQADENGALFYHVEPRCGSLPCPPYDQQKEMTCAVCTR
jgi:hypothetical protein